MFDVETQHEHFIQLEEETILCPILAMTTDPKGVTKFHLSCFFDYHVSKRSIIVTLDASTDFFDPTTVDSMTRRLQVLIEQILSLPISSPLGEFALLLPHEIEL